MLKQPKTNRNQTSKEAVDLELTDLQFPFKLVLKMTNNIY